VSRPYSEILQRDTCRNNLLSEMQREDDQVCLPSFHQRRSSVSGRLRFRGGTQTLSHGSK
jgi:hypothetical protein